MMFYTTVTGWILAYMVRIIKGDFVGASPDQVGAMFGGLLASPVACVGWMIAVNVIGFTVVAGGLVKSVEKLTKIIMISLFALLIVIVVRAVTLPGAGEGIAFFLKPNLDGIREHGLWTVVYAAMGQAFFTLSVGIGSQAIFGSYISREKRLMGDCITVAGVDTTVAMLCGLMIFSACFAFGVNPGGGPGLLFVTLPNIFNHMIFGQFWGSLFFLFMFLAAVTTVIAVFENIIAFAMDSTGCSRKKACIVNFLILTVLCLPCALGFNLLSGFQPFGPGSGVLDLEDFILSNNLLPGGALIFLLFCISKKGWGWNNFIGEVNAESGKGGLRFPTVLRPFYTYIVPVLILVVFIFGYIDFFK